MKNIEEQLKRKYNQPEYIPGIYYEAGYEICKPPIVNPKGVNIREMMR